MPARSRLALSCSLLVAALLLSGATATALETRIEGGPAAIGEIVLLTDQQMAAVTGGQEHEFIIACGIFGVSSAITSTFLVDFANLVQPYVGVTAMVCGAIFLEGLVWDNITVPLAEDIYDTFANAANLGDYHTIDDLYAEYSCSSAAGASDPSCYVGPNFFAEIDGTLDEWYCGHTGCMCDSDYDCDSLLCTSGWCAEDPY